MSLDGLIDRYHRALDMFARGDPDPVKQLYSQADDATLANPFGPPRRGREAIVKALDYASSRFRDGQMASSDEVARYVSNELVTILEIEHWRARVGGGDAIEPWVLRATTTFRREEGEWKMVHRHADPIATDNPSGPLRTS